jgi:solute carrier family 25 protein 39/40
MVVPAATIYMVTYDHLLKNVAPELSFPATLSPLVSGIVARTLVSTVASPLELLRTNLQATPKSASEPRTLRSVTVELRDLARSQGLRSLWRGVGPTLWRDVPFSGIYWANYEAWRAALEQRGYQGPSASFLCGVISGTTAAILTSPFDVLKTRRQALLMSLPESSRVSAASWPLIIKILRTEGGSALFAGLSPRIAKIAPACGVMIACFEVG